MDTAYLMYKEFEGLLLLWYYSQCYLDLDKKSQLKMRECVSQKGASDQTGEQALIMR